MVIKKVYCDTKEVEVDKMKLILLLFVIGLSSSGEPAWETPIVTEEGYWGWGPETQIITHTITKGPIEE